MNDGMTKDQQKAMAQAAYDSCACFKSRVASRQITREYDEALRPLGLRATQYTLLAAVTLSEGGSTITDLADALAMDRSTLSRNLKPLERRGLVRLSAEGYRRARTVEITPAGADLFRKAFALWQKAQERLKRSMSPDGWNALTRLATETTVRG